MGAPVSPATHYEVVDDRNALVGNIQHSTAMQAHQLHNALTGLPGVGELHVALVTETTVVHRQVQRLAAPAAWTLAA